MLSRQNRILITVVSLLVFIIILDCIIGFTLGGIFTFKHLLIVTAVNLVFSLLSIWFIEGKDYIKSKKMLEPFVLITVLLVIVSYIAMSGLAHLGASEQGVEYDTVIENCYSLKSPRTTIEFYDRNGKSFIPTGGSLEQIAHIDISALNAGVQRVPIVAMCDIDNPLYGPTGAAYVFSPQKGASPEEVELLDRGLRHLAKMIKQDLKVDVSNIPGGGAAGGIGAGVVAFLNAQLRMGIETVLDTVHFESMIKDADMILTGEGKLDGQSLRGKVIAGVTHRAKKAGVPVVAVVGGIGEGAEEAYKEGLSAMFSINRLPIDFSLARLDAKPNLALAVDNIMRLIQCVKS
mgnify:CR=1 FL=1